jgi:hypothetical protein
VQSCRNARERERDCVVSFCSVLSYRAICRTDEELRPTASLTRSFSSSSASGRAVSPVLPPRITGLFPFGDAGILDYDMFVLKQQAAPLHAWHSDLPAGLSSASGSLSGRSTVSPQSFASMLSVPAGGDSDLVRLLGAAAVEDEPVVMRLSPGKPPLPTTPTARASPARGLPTTGPSPASVRSGASRRRKSDRPVVRAAHREHGAGLMGFVARHWTHIAVAATAFAFGMWFVRRQGPGR